jgi:hypothetical protein
MPQPLTSKKRRVDCEEREVDDENSQADGKDVEADGEDGRATGNDVEDGKDVEDDQADGEDDEVDSAADGEVNGEVDGQVSKVVRRQHPLRSKYSSLLKLDTQRNWFASILQLGMCSVRSAGMVFSKERSWVAGRCTCRRPAAR